MQSRGSDWRTVLLAFASAGSALAVLSLVAFILAYSALGLSQPQFQPESRSPLEVLVLASGLVLIGAIFLPSAYYSLRRWLGREVPPAAPQAIKIWQGLLMILVWLGAAASAQVLVAQPVLKWITPPLYLLAIGLPVYALARLATGGLNAGSRQRFWGVLATSIALGTTLAIVAELLLALLGVFAVGIYVGFHPEQLAALQHLADELSNANTIDQIMNAAAPWLASPIAVLVALLFFSGLSPLIEETSKSLAVWTVFDRISSPAQGFVLGALSGAGFGLVESLLVSSTPDSTWAITLLVRGASSMMHITATSLTGWGIGAYRINRRPLWLIGTYALAIGLHGLWNAAVVALTFGGLRTALRGQAADPAGLILEYLGGAILVLLCLAIPLTLAAMNRRFRGLQTSAPVPSIGPSLD